MKWFYKLTGGRPMKREGMAFVDRVSVETVNHYCDKFGRRWLAINAWSMFRVAAPITQKEE